MIWKQIYYFSFFILWYYNYTLQLTELISIRSKNCGIANLLLLLFFLTLWFYQVLMIRFILYHGWILYHFISDSFYIVQFKINYSSHNTTSLCLSHKTLHVLKIHIYTVFFMQWGTILMPFSVSGGA